MTDFSTHPIELFALIVILMLVMLGICAIAWEVRRRRQKSAAELKSILDGFMPAAAIKNGAIDINEFREMVR